jgi:uncharacterized membrane protein
MGKYIERLKQPQVISLLSFLILQVVARWGIKLDDAELQSTIISVLDVFTAINGVVVVHKSDKDSII